MTSSQQRLLIIAALLAAIQFVVVPWFAAQNEQHDRLELLQQRLVRSEQLLENRDEVERIWQVVKDNEAAMLAAIPAASDQTSHRIKVQGDIQTVARDNQVTVDEFNWLTDARFVSETVEIQRAKIRLQGAVSRLAKAHLEITQALPSVRFVDVNLTPFSSRASSATDKSDPQMRLELLLEVATRKGSSNEGASNE